MVKEDMRFQRLFHHSLRSRSGGDLLYNDFGDKMCYGTGTKALSSQDLPAMTGPLKPRRNIWSRKSLCITFGGAVLIILTLSHLYSALFPRLCELGITEKAEPTSHFGIGFQLTPSYATSAIRYANGTFSNLARIDFETQTVDYEPETFYHMMQRLAESKSYRDPFAGYCNDDNIGVGPPFTRRYLRKAARRLVGLPSTEDVGRLADAIRSLKDQTEGILGHKVDEVMITAPMFKQLCRADIREAAEYVGLQPLMDTFPFHAHDGAAAYAGYGLGICKDYQNWTRCLEEKSALPKKNTLTVLYTRDVLMVSLHEMQSTYINELPYPTYVVEWQGFVTRGYHRNSDAYDVQQQSIALRLVQLPLDAYMPITKVDRVVLMGESAGGEFMASAVRKAMELLHQQESEYEMFSEETEFVAARGMAELAWRKHYDW